MTSEGSTVRPHVVVGVDGSEDAVRAVRWAEQYVQALGGTVELVSVHIGRVQHGLPPMQVHHDTATAAQIAVDEAAAELSLEPDRVQRTVLQGHASQELERLSREADLVVVGSRGSGRVVRALLGSVSTHVVQHAHCPVVVVP